MEEFLSATVNQKKIKISKEEEVEIILNSCRDIDKIFSNFSDFLFSNLKRVLLSQNLIVDVSEFNKSISKFSNKLDDIVAIHSEKFKSCEDFHKKCFELCLLLKQEFDLTKEIVEEIETGGFLNQLLEFKTVKTEGEIKDIVEDILT